jgi:hypothetical protein
MLVSKLLFTGKEALPGIIQEGSEVSIFPQQKKTSKR